MLGEVGRGDQAYLAVLDVLLVDDPAGAAEVVGVGVAVDHGNDGAFAQVLVHQFQRGLGGFYREQGVEDNPAGPAFDEGHVGQVIATHLVDLVGDLEQAVLHVQLGHAPQARVDRIGRGLVDADEALVGGHVPDHFAAGIADGQFLGLGDQPALRVLEVLAVVEGQGLEHGGVGLASDLAGRLGGLGYGMGGCRQEG
ncbi:hypothetical protein D3C77_206030 [compost metagenome]